ncbi:hypothetical protein Tco_1311665 [Tanacetum coccineum]
MIVMEDMVYRQDVIVNSSSIAWVQQDHKAATHRELRVIYPLVAAESHMDADGTLNVWEEDVGAAVAIIDGLELGSCFLLLSLLKEILLDVVGTSGCRYEVLQSFPVERIEQGNE